jgi:hypothetical protein
MMAGQWVEYLVVKMGMYWVGSRAVWRVETMAAQKVA